MLFIHYSMTMPLEEGSFVNEYDQKVIDHGKENEYVVYDFDQSEKRDSIHIEFDLQNQPQPPNSPFGYIPPVVGSMDKSLHNDYYGQKEVEKVEETPTDKGCCCM
ncbi:hypothetical protein ACQ4LE_010410 [Meloidogyne hapla]